MTSHNENRIWLLYSKALAAKTPEETNHAVQELRTELDEQSFISKRLVEAQISNLAFLDVPAAIYPRTNGGTTKLTRVP